MRFVVEHLEPRLFRWCILEYRHIIEITDGNVLFMHISNKDVSRLDALCSPTSVLQLKLNNACILDPFASRPLLNSESFDYVILGGILGDEPMQKRTQIELDIRGARRNLGSVQMSTDTAVYVAKHILEGGKMSDLEFSDEIEIELQEGESMILPFRYVLIDGKPLLPNGLIAHLKKGF